MRVGTSGNDSMISVGVRTNVENKDMLTVLTGTLGRKGVDGSSRNASNDLACSANKATVMAKRSKLDYESTSDLSLLLCG